MATTASKIVHISRTAVACAESETAGWEILDTAIHLEDPNGSDSVLLCWVAGSERDEFLTELQELIDRYRI